MTPSSKPKFAGAYLPRPRILCLHGGGTNSRILRISCRVLEAQLANQARLVYADAPYFGPPGPLVAGTFLEWGPFRTWLPPALGIGPENGKRQGVVSIDEDPSEVVSVVEKIEQSLKTAMEDDDRAGGTGPWACLLGFSQGAKIAASLLLRQQLDRSMAASLPTFEFGILIAGPSPMVSLIPSSSDTTALRSSSTTLLRVPTAHVHASHDSMFSSPNGYLYHSCSPHSRSLFVWDGDHHVPTRTKDVAAVVEMVTELLSKSSL
jgi:pimeloyl-ACP methyl ester carboxylesterase